MKDNTLIPLSHLGYLRAEGADTEIFLQGQLSNDIRELDGTRAQLSSYNSPKGRMLAVLHLFRAQDGVIMEMERGVLEATHKRLRMFVLRSRVTLTDVTGTLPALGLAGTGAAAALAAAGLAAPVEPCALARSGELTIIRRHGALPRYSLHGSAAAIAAAQRELAASARIGSSDDWRRLDILAGVPAVHPQTSDHFVPQMANLDQLGGISFTKGCYTGQEIVARLHYLGQLKRRMVTCRVPDAAVAPATPVYAGGETQAVGEVVQAAPGADGAVASVVLQLSHSADTTLALGSPEGPAITLLP